MKNQEIRPAHAFQFVSRVLLALSLCAGSAGAICGQQSTTNESKCPQSRQLQSTTAETTTEFYPSTDTEFFREYRKNKQIKNTTSDSKQELIQAYTFPTSRERFNRYVRKTVGPLTLASTALSAAIGQWKDAPEEWPQGASGYGKRYAAAFGRNAVQQSVTFGLDEALELDTTRFELSRRKGFFPRMKDALAQNITSRTKTGRRVISVPRLAGVYTAGIVSAEVWYPSRYSYKDGLRTGTTSLLVGFGVNLVREFVIRR